MDTALHAIQLAVAPVFLLTAVATLIGVLATRLGRIIDRARELEERLLRSTELPEDRIYLELSRARVRGSIVNFAVGLLTVSATFIGVTVMSLFLGGAQGAAIGDLISWSFLGGLLSFVLALLCFLLETLLASRTLEFATRAGKGPPPH